MHHEFLFCENVMKTIFGTMDTVEVWEDLKECNIWPHLWLQVGVVDCRFIKLIASHVLTNEEKKMFYPNHQEFEDTYTLCLSIQEDNQGPGFKGHEIT
jgi:hypothetical protein